MNDCTAHNFVVDKIQINSPSSCFESHVRVCCAVIPPWKRTKKSLKGASSNQTSVYSLLYWNLALRASRVKFISIKHTGCTTGLCVYTHLDFQVYINVVEFFSQSHSYKITSIPK